jgi:hypothetical protein
MKFRHLKGHHTSFSNDSSTAHRCITSSVSPYLDFTVFLLVHGLLNAVFDIADLETWYTSRQMLLPIKEEWLERPIFYLQNHRNQK